MSSSASDAARAFVPPASPLVHPLDEFYAQARLPLPKIEVVEGARVPEPYRTLLVHERDMTPTLKSFFKDEIAIEVLRRQQRDDYYFREVLLKLRESGRPVEFGAIKINLGLFPSAARRQILEEALPLGQILEETAVAHSSRPKAYLRLSPDAFIGGILGASEPTVLFGRRNTLLDPVQRPLAEIVEILPPIPESGAIR